MKRIRRRSTLSSVGEATDVIELFKGNIVGDLNFVSDSFPHVIADAGLHVLFNLLHIGKVVDPVSIPCFLSVSYPVEREPVFE